MLDLVALTGGKYRVVMDESWSVEQERDYSQKWWYQEIRGRHGFIYPFSETSLIAYFHAKKVGLRTYHQNQDKCSIHRVGVCEIELRFNPKDWPVFCEAILARKKRHLTPQQRQQALINLSKAKKPRLNGSTDANLGLSPQ